jgi:type IV secretory pathway TraG/TraD family ATPase VirD4
VAHGEAQLASRWGDHGRQVVMDTSNVKVFLPGITDTSTLDAASKLCGQAAWKIRGHYHQTWHDIATPDMIRQLPAGYALVIRGGYAPTIARLPRAWNNPLYRRARRTVPSASLAVTGPVPHMLPPSRPPRLASPDHGPDDRPGGGDTPKWN